MRRPGVYPVLDGVFRIPLPLPNDGLSAVNVYVINDGAGLVLIDSGWALAESQRQLERSLADIDYKLADIRQFLVTHVHQDHYGQADRHPPAVRHDRRDRRRRAARPRLLIDPGATHAPPTGGGCIAPVRRPAAARWQRPATARAQRRRTARAARHLAPPGPVELRSARARGGRDTGAYRRARRVPRPGRGGPVRRRSRAAADHPVDRARTGRLPCRSPTYMDSLRLMLPRPDARCYRLTGRRRERPRAGGRAARPSRAAADRVAAAVDPGATTPRYEVAHTALDPPRASPLDMDIFNQSMAIGETVAHLDVCVMRGWLTSFDDELGTRHYQRA